jgi:hypothetical protein
MNNYKNSIKIFKRLKEIYKKLGNISKFNKYNILLSNLINNNVNNFGGVLKKKINKIEKENYFKELNDLEKYFFLLNIKGIDIELINKLIDLNIIINSPEDLLNDSVKRKLRDNNKRLTILQISNIMNYINIIKKKSMNKIELLTKDLKKYLCCRNINIKKIDIYSNYKNKNENEIEIFYNKKNKLKVEEKIIIDNLYKIMVLYKLSINKFINRNTKLSMTLTHNNNNINTNILIL